MPDVMREGKPTLVGAVRRLAFDRTLPASEALGRIHDYDRQRGISE